jgi:hypothetical protein
MRVQVFGPFGGRDGVGAPERIAPIWVGVEAARSMAFVPICTM